MQERIRTGRAMRDGRVIADLVEVTERVESRLTPVPLPGSASVGHKQQTIRHPTTVTFRSIADEALRGDLDRLAQAAHNVEVGRRDRGWQPDPIDIVLDDGSQALGAFVDRPFNGYGALEVIAFTLRHDAL